MSKQEQFNKAKKILDRVIKATSDLAEEAFDEALEFCTKGELDLRDDLEEVASALRIAEGYLIMARSKAGRINSGPVTRSGGT